MVNTTIIFIRHGDVENPAKTIYGSSVDVRLSKKGFGQIADTAKVLKNKGIYPDIIYASNLTRAISSAKKMAETFIGTPIIIEKDLRDVDHEGLEEFTTDWVHKIGCDLYNYKGEEFKEITIEQPEKQVKRITEAVSFILKENQGKTIFVICHGDPTAFTTWKLIHPNENLPTILEIRKEGLYLKKSQALKMIFDDECKVINYQFISCKNENWD